MSSNFLPFLTKKSDKLLIDFTLVERHETKTKVHIKKDTDYNYLRNMYVGSLCKTYLS